MIDLQKNQLLFLLLLCPWFLFSQVLDLYNQQCAGCHASDLKGTPAGSSLLESPLKYGDSHFALSKSIELGIKGTPMIGWGELLKKDQIDSLADFILKKRAQKPQKIQEASPQIIMTKEYKIKIEIILPDGMTHPWGIDFINENTAYITGHKGELYRMTNGKLDDVPIKNLPEVFAYDMVGGMMDIILDPNHPKNGWIYLSYSYTPTGTKDPYAPGMTKIVRGKIKNNRWVEQQTLFEAADSIFVKGGKRWGSRFLFDRKGYLYFSIGDMQQSVQSGNNPQLKHRAEGKVFRIYPDGSIPIDNPYGNDNTALKGIYAWGTRNVQGIAQHPKKDIIYFTDHGPRGGDEINLLQNGANYGWPIISYGVNYNKSIITPYTEKEGMEQPIRYYDPSIAICAAEFVIGDLFKKWENDLLVTALKYQEIRRLKVDGKNILEEEIIMKGMGRVRDVKIGPDQAIWVLTNAPDQLLRITPIE